MLRYVETEVEVEVCEKCGRLVIPTGIWSMPLEGFCECIFWRLRCAHGLALGARRPGMIGLPLAFPLAPARFAA